MNIAAFVLLLSLFGSKTALLYLASCFTVAVLLGFAFGRLRLRDHVNPAFADLIAAQGPEDRQVAGAGMKARKELLRSLGALLHFLPVLVLAAAVGAGIKTWLPVEWVTSLGWNNNVLAVLLATLVGALIYADVIVILPIGYALLEKGLNQGIVFAFMAAAAGISLPSLILLSKILSRRLLALMAASLLGSLVGMKLPLIVWPSAHGPPWDGSFLKSFPILIFSGKTIVGGLLGGWLAIELAKRVMDMKRRTGDPFAPALAIGLAFGRIGCFLNGCCHGIASSLPWACDFGDGLPRHPTQLYSAVFDFGLFVWLWCLTQERARGGGPFQALSLRFLHFSLYDRIHQGYAEGSLGTERLSVGHPRDTAAVSPASRPLRSDEKAEIRDRKTIGSPDDLSFCSHARLGVRPRGLVIEEARAEGEREGKLEGEREGKREAARNFMQLGVTVDIIEKATGLSQKEIEGL